MKRLLYLVGMLVASACLANVIRVPEDYSSLPQAIAITSDGDTIDLAPIVIQIDQQMAVEKSISIIGRNPNNRTELFSTAIGSLSACAHW